MEELGEQAAAEIQRGMRDADMWDSRMPLSPRSRSPTSSRARPQREPPQSPPRSITAAAAAAAATTTTTTTTTTTRARPQREPPQAPPFPRKTKGYAELHQQRLDRKKSEKEKRKALVKMRNRRLQKKRQEDLRMIRANILREQREQQSLNLERGDREEKEEGKKEEEKKEEENPTRTLGTPHVIQFEQTQFIRPGEDGEDGEVVDIDETAAAAADDDNDDDDDGEEELRHGAANMVSLPPLFNAPLPPPPFSFFGHTANPH